MALTSAHETERGRHDGTDSAPAEETATATIASSRTQVLHEEASQRAAVPDKLHRLLVSILAAFVAVPSTFWWIMQASTILKDPGGFDFCIYFAAALALRDNPHANILDLHVIQAAALRHHAPNPVMSYVYPPLMAVALVPLTQLPYVEAARLWVELNLVLWLVATALLAGLFAYALRGVQPNERRAASSARGAGLVARLRGKLNSWRHPSTIAVFALGTAVFASLSHEPAVKGVMLGQVSIVIYFLLVLAPWLMRRGQPELAGAVLALATVIKIFPIVLIGYYVMRGRWRVTAGAAAGFAILIALMVHVVGLQGLLATRAIFTVGTQLSAAANNQALAHVPMWVAAELGRQPGPKTLRLGYVLIATVAAIFALGMVGTALRDFRMRHETPADQVAGSPHDLVGYAWAICTMLLVSPIVWEHYGSWLLPAFACCLGYAAHRLAHLPRNLDSRVSRLWAIFAVVAVVAAYAATARLFPFNYDSEAGLSPGPYLGQIAIRPLFMVLRPLGTTMVWVASGWLFLRPRLVAREAKPSGLSALWHLVYRPNL
jgi:Glycosyltransferase family 87